MPLSPTEKILLHMFLFSDIELEYWAVSKYVLGEIGSIVWKAKEAQLHLF